MENIDKLNNSLTETLKQTQIEKEQTQNSLTNQIKEVSQLQSDLTDKTKLVNELQNKIATLESKLQVQESNIIELSNVNDDLVEQLKTEQIKSDHVKINLEKALFKNQEKYREQIQDLEKKLSNSQTEVEKLLILVKNLNEYISTLDSAFTDFGNLIDKYYASSIKDLQESRNVSRPKRSGTAHNPTQPCILYNPSQTNKVVEDLIGTQSSSIFSSTISEEVPGENGTQIGSDNGISYISDFY